MLAIPLLFKAIQNTKSSGPDSTFFHIFTFALFICIRVITFDLWWSLIIRNRTKLFNWMLFSSLASILFQSYLPLTITAFLFHDITYIIAFHHFFHSTVPNRKTFQLILKGVCITALLLFFGAILVPQKHSVTCSVTINQKRLLFGVIGFNNFGVYVQWNDQNFSCKT